MPHAHGFCDCLLSALLLDICVIYCLHFSLLTLKKKQFANTLEVTYFSKYSWIIWKLVRTWLCHYDMLAEFKTGSCVVKNWVLGQIMEKHLSTSYKVLQMYLNAKFIENYCLGHFSLVSYFYYGERLRTLRALLLHKCFISMYETSNILKWYPFCNMNILMEYFNQGFPKAIKACWCRHPFLKHGGLVTSLYSSDIPLLTAWRIINIKQYMYS